VAVVRPAGPHRPGASAGPRRPVRRRAHPAARARARRPPGPVPGAGVRRRPPRPRRAAAVL